MAVAPCLAASLALTACITTPLQERDWLAVQTAHYDIWSSLGEDETTRLASELERFRAAAEFVWGSAIAPAPVRTRVYAFDDRGIGRPFALRSQRSYLVPRQRGDLIVLRTGEGWGGDARTPLKLEYARRLFWNATSDALPPWYEEALPQLASTVEIRGRGASIGIPRGDHVAALREGQWIPFERLLAAADLNGWSALELSLFEAETWALAHYLGLDANRRAESPPPLARFRSLLAEGQPADAAARSAFGDRLQKAVWRHVTARELPSLSVAIQRIGAQPVARPVPRREVLEELGSLALAIGEAERASDYLEQALERSPGSVEALAGLGDALARLGDAAGADARYAAARAADRDDPRRLLGQARLWLDRAERSADPGERARLAVEARKLYRRCIAVAPRIPEGHAGLAETHLFEGEPAEGTPALRTARALLPADASISVLAARLALARGEHEEARREAHRLWSRARSAPEREIARNLLDRIDTRAARN